MDLCILVFECDTLGNIGKLRCQSEEEILPVIKFSPVLTRGSYVCMCVSFRPYFLTSHRPDLRSFRFRLAVTSVPELKIELLLDNDNYSKVDCLIQFVLTNGNNKKIEIGSANVYKVLHGQSLFWVIENTSAEK